jgi:hypothetical protein
MIFRITEQTRSPIVAGVLVRRPVRRILLAAGVEFREERGWLDSAFFLRVPPGQVLEVSIPD